jgi:hypothetical protein
VEAGEIEPADPAELALAWRVFLDGLLLNLRLAVPGEAPCEDHLEAPWSACWRGLSGRKPRE